MQDDTEFAVSGVYLNYGEINSTTRRRLLHVGGRQRAAPRVGSGPSRCQGGDDLGPTALELAVMALSGCISTIFAIVAKNSKVTYHKFVCDVEADKPDDAPTIVTATAKIYVESADGYDKINRVLSKTMAACPVGQLYEKAGVHIGTELEVKEI